MNSGAVSSLMTLFLALSLTFTPNFAGPISVSGSTSSDMVVVNVPSVLIDPVNPLMLSKLSEPSPKYGMSLGTLVPAPVLSLD